MRLFYFTKSGSRSTRQKTTSGKLSKKKIIVIGRFWMHKNSEQVILGSILAKIQDQVDRNEQVFPALD